MKKKKEEKIKCPMPGCQCFERIPYSYHKIKRQEFLNPKLTPKQWEKVIEDLKRNRKLFEKARKVRSKDIFSKSFG
jgi:hypothetical protein